MLAQHPSGFASCVAAPVNCPHSAIARPPQNGHPAVTLGHQRQNQQPWTKKYVILCFMCGGLAVLLGVILMGIYFTLRSYTSSLHFFETIPTYVPAVVLIITGLLIMCFAKRRNRYSYLIKLTGACLVICTLLCVVITVTTTVIHMNRLQTLRECVYTQKAKTCTCFSGPGSPQISEGGSRFVFNNTPNCESIHGSLYSCLRGLFGLSVVGILICIFSSMLVYQLLTHERKKSYWEQMEIRRRFFFRRHPHYPYCGCYDEIYPWYPWEIMDDPLWRTSPSGTRNNNTATGNVRSSSAPRESQYGSGRRTSILRWLPWPWRCVTSRLSHSDNGTQTINVNETRATRDHRPMLRNFDHQRSREQRIFLSRNPRNSRRTNEERIGSIIGTTLTSGLSATSISHYRRNRRSNEVSLHHMNLVNRYQHLLVSNQRGRGLTSNQLHEFSIPRHMWGPPPPYPHSPMSEFSVNLQNSSCRRSRNAGGGDNIQRINEEQSEDGSRVVAAPLSEMVQSIESSDSLSLVDETKRQSPAEDDLNGGEIHILTVDVHPTRQFIRDGETDRGKDGGDRSCLVEIHVPFVEEVINRKGDVSSFTLPLRQSRKVADIQPFKSLSNIPLYLSQKLSSIKQNSEDSCCNLDESNIEMLEESLVQKLCQFSEETNVVPDGRYILNDGILTTLCSSSDSSPLLDNVTSSPEYGPTIVELFTDYKSRIVIATTPCTPVHDDVPLAETICVTRSMPNLYCSTCMNSGPVTVTTSCCSGSASSIGCSTTSLPEDIFSGVDETNDNPNIRDQNRSSSDEITEHDLEFASPYHTYTPQTSSDDPSPCSSSKTSFSTTTSSSCDHSYCDIPVQECAKRSRVTIIRQNAVNDSSSSGTECGAEISSRRNKHKRGHRTTGSSHSNRRLDLMSLKDKTKKREFCDSPPSSSDANISYIAVNPVS
ncbi:Uncharacterised protein g2438 [Pycnogonum litorale]